MVATLISPRQGIHKSYVPHHVSTEACINCGAVAPVATPEGFQVCSTCGCEYADSQPYTCSDPMVRAGMVASSHMVSRPQSRTMVGTLTERTRLAPQLTWAERVGLTYEQEIAQDAYFEIRRILTILDLAERQALFDASMAGFAKAYATFPKGSRSRSVHLLSLIASYRALRIARLPVKLKDFLATCLDAQRHTPRQFMTALKVTALAFPRVHPSEIIPREVSAIISRLGMPKTIQDATAAILKVHLKAFRSPKTAVRAAAIVGAATIASGQRADFPLSIIAKAAGIATSALLRCVADACAFYHQPLEGSIVHAGAHVQSLFLTPAEPVALKKAPKVPSPPASSPTKASPKSRSPPSTVPPIPANTTIKPARIAPKCSTAEIILRAGALFHVPALRDLFLAYSTPLVRTAQEALPAVVASGDPGGSPPSPGPPL